MGVKRLSSKKLFSFEQLEQQRFVLRILNQDGQENKI